MILSLPADYFLSSSGVDFFISSKLPVKEMRGRESGVENGFTWKSCKADFLSKIVGHGMLNGMEVRRLEFYTKRQDFMKLIEVVITAAIVLDFRPTIRRSFVSSKERLSLYEKASSQGNRKLFQDPNYPPLHKLKAELKKQFEIDKGMQQVFPWLKMNLIEQLLERISYEVWFVLSAYSKGPTGKKLSQWLTDEITLALRKINLSEEIAIFILEYLQLAEQSHFLNLAQRDRYARQQGFRVRDLLGNPEFRERLIRRAEQQGEMISFSIRVSEYNPSEVRIPTITFIIRNRGIFGADQRTLVQAKREGDPLAVSLDSVLQQKGTQEIETSLLALYLASLQKACKAHNSTFDAQMVQDSRTRETVSRISLGF